MIKKIKFGLLALLIGGVAFAATNRVWESQEWLSGHITTPSNPSAGKTKMYFKSDNKLYKLTSGGTETEVGAGSGDLVGPATSTDEAVCRFDGTTGKLAQNSVVGISDTGDVTGVTSLTLSGAISGGTTFSGTGATLSGLTASRALTTDGSKNLTSSSVTSTELGYVSGVTSAIQTQIDSKTTLTSVTGSDVVQNVGLAASVSANALTVALKDASGADCSGGSPCQIGFRNSTATTGQYSVVSRTSALSATLSSGSTIGSISGNVSYVYVYAINNAGTIELALSGTDTVDEGALVSTTAEGGSGAADAKATLYSTTARANVAARLIGRVTSTQATAGTWATSPSQISLVPFPKIYDSEITVDSGNGHGSTATKIRRWSNIRKNTGAGAIVYADDATNGGSFTINEPGEYSFACHDSLSSGTPVIGITVNDSATTTNMSTPVTYAQGTRSYNQGCSACATATSWTGKLAVGDVVRLHTQGNQNSTDASSMCTAVQVSR